MANLAERIEQLEAELESVKVKVESAYSAAMTAVSPPAPVPPAEPVTPATEPPADAPATG